MKEVNMTIARLFLKKFLMECSNTLKVPLASLTAVEKLRFDGLYVLQGHFSNNKHIMKIALFRLTLS
jgi:hypothetical protein